MKNLPNGILGLLTAAFLVLVPPTQAQAQDACMEIGTDCSSESSCYQCKYGIEIEGAPIQKSPTTFKFQSRISQAKLPVGDATFPTVIVYLMRGNTKHCKETFYNVRVRDSVLNLDIGHTMSCQLDEIIAKYNSLSFQICIESEENCLKPIALSTVPYAVKSTFAQQAQEAHTANTAAECHYAHRITADRNLFAANQIGKGYYDFHTPHETDFLFSQGQSVPDDNYRDGGFILWTPVQSEDAILHLAAKGVDNDQAQQLDQLMMHSRRTTLRGVALIEGNTEIDPSLLNCYRKYSHHK